MSDDAALRALRDCVVIRTKAGNRAYGRLVERGFAEPVRRFVGREWVCDYRLTWRGREAATLLPPAGRAR